MEGKTGLEKRPTETGKKKKREKFSYIDLRQMF
jgi:hypothetical protein